MPPRVRAPVQRSRVIDHHADSVESADRMIGQLVDAADRSLAAPRSTVVVDLEVGVNRVNTLLGRRAIGCTLTPTVADATFAWAFAAVGDYAGEITVIGVAQPGAAVEFY